MMQSRSSRTLSTSLSSQSRTDAIVVIEVEPDAAVRIGVSGEPRSRGVVSTRTAAVQTDERDDGSKYRAAVLANLDTALLRYVHADIHNMRVALVLPHATTLRKRRLVSAILFDEFEVREIAYMPAAQCSLAALGLCTAMLIKIGHSSCSVNPIYDGRMLFYQGKDSQIGLDAMHRRARLLLSRHTSGLTDGDVRNFVYRHASVSSMRMATSEKHSIDDEAAVPASGEHEVSDEVQWRQPSTGTSISLPAWYGKATAEVLFEADGAYADTDEVGLGRMLRDVLAACPLDTRTELRRIVVTGVGHRLPGLQARLSAELPGSKIVVHGMADDLTWTGASLAAHLRWRVPTLTATAWEEAQGNLAS